MSAHYALLLCKNIFGLVNKREERGWISHLVWGKAAIQCPRARCASTLGMLFQNRY